MSKKPNKEIGDDPILNRVLDLLVQQRKTEKDMTIYLNISSSAFTAWKYGGRKTYLKHIGKMAEYLNVSPNYLLYGIDEDINEKTLSVIEVELLNMFRNMNPNQKDCIIRTSRCFVNQ